MVFRNFDLLSPKITLYYEGLNRHKSVPSACLTIFVYIILSVIMILYLFELFEKRTKTSHTYKKFEKDIGEYSLLSNIFHYVTIGSSVTI